MKMVLEPALYGRFWASDVDKVLLGDTIVIKEERKPRHGRHGELCRLQGRARNFRGMLQPEFACYNANSLKEATK